MYDLLKELDTDFKEKTDKHAESLLQERTKSPVPFFLRDNKEEVFYVIAPKEMSQNDRFVEEMLAKDQSKVWRAQRKNKEVLMETIDKEKFFEDFFGWSKNLAKQETYPLSDELIKEESVRKATRSITFSDDSDEKIYPPSENLFSNNSSEEKTKWLLGFFDSESKVKKPVIMNDLMGDNEFGFKLDEKAEKIISILFGDKESKEKGKNSSKFWE